MKKGLLYKDKTSKYNIKVSTCDAKSSICNE